LAAKRGVAFAARHEPGVQEVSDVPLSSRVGMIRRLVWQVDDGHLSYGHEGPARPTTGVTLLTGGLLVRIQPEEHSTHGIFRSSCRLVRRAPLPSGLSSF